MQRSAGVVKHGFSIPEEDYDWINTSIDTTGFHPNMSDFVSAAILRTVDNILTTGRLDDDYSRIGFLKYLQTNFYDTIPEDSRFAKIQVRFPVGLDQMVINVCNDCMQYSEIPMLSGSGAKIARSIAICSIRFYISLRCALDGSPPPLPASYKHGHSAADNLRSLTDLRLMCSGFSIDENVH